MNARWLPAGLIAVVGTAVAGFADDRNADEPKAPTRAQPAQGAEAAIRAQAAAFVKAFNAGDAPAIGRLFTAEARAVDVAGEAAEGRAAIEQEYAELFKENPGLAIEIHVDDVHLVGPGTAVEEGTSRVIPKDGAPPVVNHYSAVNLKREGAWLIASVRETPGELSGTDQLRALEWLVGDWVDESSDSTIESSCRWSPDKQALIRDFTIRANGKVAMTGTQRIGWDPAAEQIRSWEFDSEGGHGEGLWARLGNQWLIKATAVLQDGRTATATHLLTPENPSTCRWRTTDRTIGGHVIPVADEFVMVRPAPGAKAK